MPRFFIAPEEVDHDGRIVILKGDNAHHIAYSLRMRTGDMVNLCDQRNDYTCELIEFDGETVTARICAETPVSNEPPYIAHLYQALPKGDKLDTVIQKAVECGVTTIIPFTSSRCIAQIKPEAEARKTERRARIAAEAAKQCGRGVIPTVAPTVDFETMLAAATRADLVLFCYEGQDTTPLPVAISALSDRIQAHRPPEIAVIVGSEGGFSPQEAEAARLAGCSLVGLGSRILRTETASPFVLGCLVYALELAKHH